MGGNYLTHPIFQSNNFLKNPQITSIFIVKPNFNDMEKPKYIMLYNGKTFKGTSLETLAKDYMGYRIVETPTSFEIYINGKRVSSYVNVKENKRDGYTQNEVEKDFFRNFAERFTYKNLCFYKLIDS